MIREQDILKLPSPQNGWNEEAIRSAIERNGIDFARTTYVQGSAPNRMWANNPDEFSTTLHLKVK